MHEILIAVTVCCAVSVTLAVIILIADAVFGNYGTCEIDINNGARKLQVPGGRPLLSTLSNEGIFIPSACGGKGACGLCKLQVLSGGGEVFATETPWLTKEEIADNVRLACQLKVKRDLAIVIPERYFLVKEFTTEVTAITDLTHDIKEVTLKLLKPDSVTFRAGQFMQIQVPVYELTKVEVYRAYSISSPPDRTDSLEFEIRLVPNGICTTYVHQYLKVGDKVTVNGPYGEFYLRDSEREIVFIAGGSGMAPIKSILFDMKAKGNQRKATYFFGAVSKQDLFHVETMRQLEAEMPNFKFVPALSQPKPEDHWDGATGLVTEVLERHLEGNADVEAYLCGSPGMINACVKVLNAKGVPENMIFFDKFA